MNRQFIISAIVLTLVTLGFGFVVHATLLNDLYGQFPGVYRSIESQEEFFVWMVLAHVSLGIGLTWVYRMGRQSRPWLGQGIRFGLALVVLAIIPTYLIYYAVTNISSDLAMMQIVYDGIAWILVGVITAALNRS